MSVLNRVTDISQQRIHDDVPDVGDDCKTQTHTGLQSRFSQTLQPTLSRWPRSRLLRPAWASHFVWKDCISKLCTCLTLMRCIKKHVSQILFRLCRQYDFTHQGVWECVLSTVQRFIYQKIFAKIKKLNSKVNSVQIHKTELKPTKMKVTCAQLFLLWNIPFSKINIIIMMLNFMSDTNIPRCSRYILQQNTHFSTNNAKTDFIKFSPFCPRCLPVTSD